MSAPFAIGILQPDGTVKYNISQHEESLSNIIDILYNRDGKSGYNIHERKTAQSIEEYFSETYHNAQEEDTRFRCLKQADGIWIIRDFYMGHKDRIIKLEKSGQNAGFTVNKRRNRTKRNKN
jgi:hypothetical protein